jgi:transcriptional regulator with XRE-family HTH domain
MYDIICLINKKGPILSARIGENDMWNYGRIKDLREDKDLSQAEVAELLQISQQHYSLYESGKRELPMHHFITLAKFYNVSLDYLAGQIDQPRKLR